jgi:hypothetical protein
MQGVINVETSGANKTLQQAPDQVTKDSTLADVQKLGKKQGEIKKIADDLAKKLAQ